MFTIYGTQVINSTDTSSRTKLNTSFVVRDAAHEDSDPILSGNAIRLTNEGVHPVYFKLGDNSVTATTSDNLVSAGMSRVISWDISKGFDYIALVSASGESGSLSIEMGTASDTELASATVALPVANLFILAGQSNNHGSAATSVTNAPIHYKEGKIANSKLWTDNEKFEDLELGSTHYYGTSSGAGWFGPLVSLADAIGKKSISDNYYVQSSRGGTDLYTQWEATDGPLYKRLIERVKNAKAYLESQGYSVRLKGFCFNQGEGDASDLTKANAYEDNEVAFINALRADLGDSGLKVVIIRLSDNTTYTYKATIQAAQDAVAAALSNVTVINTDNYPAFPVDTVHYGNQGMIRMGREIATAFGYSLLKDELSIFDCPSLLNLWCPAIGGGTVVSSDLNDLADMADGQNHLTTPDGTGPDYVDSVGGVYSLKDRYFIYINANINDYLKFTTALDLADYSIFYMMYADGNDVGLSLKSSWDQRHVLTSTACYMNHGSGQSIGPFTHTNGQWTLLEYHFTGSEGSIVADGVEIGSGAISGNFTPDGIVRYNTSSMVTTALYGVAVFNYISDANELAEVRSALNQMFGKV